jgi:hypothetical protein
MFSFKRRITKAAALAGVALSFGLAAASPASADYCNDFGMCNAPRWTVYYSYDWYYSGERLSWYQLRLCNWVNAYGRVYAISYC